MKESHNTIQQTWVLGGTGFIGSALTGVLTADTSVALTMLVHHSVPYRSLEGVNLVRGSLENFDFSWFGRFPPDVIFHLARLGGRSPLGRYVASNRGLKANRRLITGLAALDRPPVIVYVSGSLMYGNQPDGVVALESSLLAPTAYAKQYYRAEEPWLTTAVEAGLEVKMVRPGWIIGQGSWFRTFYWNHYVSTGRIPVYGDGNQLMSVVHVDDLAAMLARVPSMGPGVINLFAGPPVTQSEFTLRLAKILQVTRESVPLGDVAGRYGKAAAEALGSSIPLGTLHSGLWESHKFSFPDLDSMLLHTVGLLKSEQRVLPEAPQWSAAEPYVGLP